MIVRAGPTSTRSSPTTSGPPESYAGWTQDETAHALEGLLGQRLPQASISAIERAYEGDRRREFDAHEILAFALAFDLPLVWFFLPPPGDHRGLHHTTNIVSELYGIVFGQEAAARTRLRAAPPTWHRRTHPSRPHHREPHGQAKPGPPNQLPRRGARRLLLALLDQYTDQVDQAAEEIGAFFDHLRQVGVRGLVAEHLSDGDYIGLPQPEAASEPRKPTRKS